MKDDVFRFKAEVIELQEKPMVAEGIQGQNVAGDTPTFDVDDMGRTSHRAILDVGLLDIAVDNLQPANADFEIIGASSDMLVLDVGDHASSIKIGDFVSFKVDYMGVLSLMNSRYIDKRIAS
jgi:predicted amino acid racemase